MRIHKEGTITLIVAVILLFALNFFVDSITCLSLIRFGLAIPSIVLFIFLVSFFRNPIRETNAHYGDVASPADGTVVVIEETEETEYFHDRRIQVSIFMSPADVHVNRAPIKGEVKLVQYHAGKHLIASRPKSSTENERNTIVIADGSQEILLRQIAGILARRIVCYLKTGDHVTAGQQLGFIKFGSRVDIFFPLNAQILVNLNQIVIGGKTVIGNFPN